MRFLWLHGVVVSIAFQTLALGQTATPTVPAGPPPRILWATLAEPPVPSDPLELITANAQPVLETNERAAVINLLSSARALSNVRAQAYDLKTTFTAVGSSPSDGSWQLEDISPRRNLYRWTAQGPSYSAVNLYSNNVLYSNQPATGIPLRLAQVRGAIFFTPMLVGPRASIRTANANLNGTEVTCVLVARMSPVKPVAGGRRWDEEEYCVDPKSGLLMTSSAAPGLYVLYDYANALHFHDRIIPGKFTITEAGQPVIEARLESITDPGNLDRSLFDPAGLNSIGVGSTMTGSWKVRSMVPSASGGASSGMQVVVLHGMLSPDGHLSDTEVLASSNAGLNQSALERAAQWQNWQAGNEGQPGATPQSHEVFFTVQFANPGT